ncbi:MAG: hypothetical protein IJ930_09745 [Lachnospiraceae bacterium]|nr:hypothetical protein [Lachnospiraceae bacterium]
MELKKVERKSSFKRPVKAFDKMSDFDNGRYNPLLLHNYGRNIYRKGQKIGYCLDIRIPGYRGLPINQIAKLAFEVDGKWIDDDCKYIWYDGKDFPISAIGTGRFDNEWMWKYQDYLRVFFEIPGGIDQGIHHVKYGIYLRDHYSTTALCEKDVTIV